jgi:hypothetical protein
VQAKSESARDHHRDHLFSDRVPVRPEPFLVQGEAESTGIDIAARVSGRLEKIAIARGQNVATGAIPLVIDNPGLVTERDRGKRRIRRLARDTGDRRFRSAHLCGPCLSGRQIHGLRAG